ncbi:hypothetical protein Tco_0173106 [Tanacetum coccineum]
MTLQELMVFCTTLSKKVKSLEIDLKQTKLTYGAAYTKHIKKERHEHDMEFDFDLDAAKDVSTAEKDVSTAKPVSTAGAVVTIASVAAVNTACPERRVSTANDITMAETLVYIRKSATKDKGKGKMDESEPVQTKTKDDKETDEHEEVEADDTAELKKHLVIKKDVDIAIDVIPLATKPPVIADYKLLKEGIMGINREDLKTLWKLVKTKHGDLRPEDEDEHERVLWGDLKVMFEPDIRSDVWRNLQGYKVTIWKLIDSCGVHFVRFANVYIFMLVEKRYILTPITITNMLNKKLKAGHWNEMCYQLLKLMIQKMNIKFRGGLLGLKRLQGFLLLLSTVSIELLLSVEVKTAQICAAGYKDTTAAELQLLEDLLLSRG